MAELMVAVRVVERNPYFHLFVRKWWVDWEVEHVCPDYSPWAQAESVWR